MGASAAARVGDRFGHSAAVAGTALGLSVAPFAIGALIGTAILTGGVSLIAVGAAIAITGGAGLAGELIGSTIEGPTTGNIEIGSPNVIINGRSAAMTVRADGHCSKDSGSAVPVATGAATVFINGQPAARLGERMACSAVIREGSVNVFIGGPSHDVIKPSPEVPALLHNAMLAMVWGGTAVGTLGVGLTYGAGAALGSLAGGLGGSYVVGAGARSAAAALGYGATGQAVAQTIGGLVGGAIGGGAGFRGGMAGEAALAGRLPPRPGSFRSLAESEAAADRVIAAGLKPEKVSGGVPLSPKGVRLSPGPASCGTADGSLDRLAQEIHRTASRPVR